MPVDSSQTLAQQLCSAFPSPQEIPAEFRPNPSEYERLYLLDGRVETWQGAVSEVTSPICIRQGEGCERALIGNAPVRDEAAVLAALDAAVRAWDNGRGAWPTASERAYQLFHVRGGEFRIRANLGQGHFRVGLLAVGALSNDCNTISLHGRWQLYMPAYAGAFPRIGWEPNRVELLARD